MGTSFGVPDEIAEAIMQPELHAIKMQAYQDGYDACKKEMQEMIEKMQALKTASTSSNK